jgi:ElaB/YqjD/DUF883 family membrane-anchored ribosome-binding protein
MPTNRNHIGSHARNAVSELQLEAKTIGTKAQQRAAELSETARERAYGLQHQLEERITKNPMKAILIAAGLGVAVGCMWRR